MRQSLKKSIAESPNQKQDHYPAGSIVVCNQCTLPIYKLDRPIGLGQAAGRGASAFKPLSMQDLADLEDRRDIDPGLRAMVLAWPLEKRHAHTQMLNEPKAGDPMLCPCCGETFVQVLTTEESETHDRAYTIELLTIPPKGITAAPLKGRKDFWVHH